jgi:large subunit ribosomal protein L21
MSYAIFRALGKQFRAEKGKTLKLPLMVAEPGAKITFDEVLLSSDGTTISADSAGEGRQGDGRGRGSRQGREAVRLQVRAPEEPSPQDGHRQKHTEVRIADVKVAKPWHTRRA